MKISQFFAILTLAFVAMASAPANAGLRQDLSTWHNGQPPIGACMLEWDECRVLAKDGNARAQFLVGYAYSMGLRPDGGGLPEAFTWLERAAQQRMPSAMLLLGRLYREGDGTARDNVSAAMWFDLARELAPDDQIQTSADYELHQLKWKMTDVQMHDAADRARNWLNRHSAEAVPASSVKRPKTQIQ